MSESERMAWWMYARATKVDDLDGEAEDGQQSEDGNVAP